MKKLHLFLLKSFIKPFLLTFISTVFLLLMQFLWKYIDDLVGKGLELHHIADLLFYASARFIPIALPMSILLSSVLVFGKLAEQYELAALKSSGISLFRIMKPCLLLSFVLAIGSFLFSNYIMPIANLENATKIYEIQKKKPTINIKEGVFYNDFEKFNIRIEKKENNGEVLKNILIYNKTNAFDNNHVITAKKGRMKLTKDEKILELSLFDGYSFMEVIGPKEKNEFRRTNFKKNLVRINLQTINTSINADELYRGHYAMLNNFQLSNAIDSISEINSTKIQTFKKKIKNEYFSKKDTINKPEIKLKSISNLNFEKQKYNISTNKIRSLKSLARVNKNNTNYKKLVIARHKIEWHRKFSLAFACIIFYLIGAPLGSIIRKGGFGLPVLISVLFFVCYHILNMIGEKSARELSLYPYEGMWLANIICIPLAIILTLKVKNNVQLLDLTRIKILLNRYNFFKKN